MDLHIDQELCRGCGLCEKVCILVNNFGFPSISQAPDEFCLRCGHCAAVCPERAVGLFDNKGREEQNKRIPDSEEIVALIRANRTLRNFLPRVIPPEIWKDFAEVCRFSSTSMNFQEVRALFIQDPALIVRISQAAKSTLKLLGRLFRFPLSRLLLHLTVSPLAIKYLRINSQRQPPQKPGTDQVLFNAPALILLAAPKRLESAIVDCTIMAVNLNLTAASHCLGACFIGAVPHGFMLNNRKLKKLIPVPKGYTVYQCLAIGFPAVRNLRIPPRQRVDAFLGESADIARYPS